MCDSGVDETKVRVFKYRPIGESQWCIADSFDAVKDELDLCNDDDGIEVMPVTMTRHQLDNLPEFTGWHSGKQNTADKSELLPTQLPPK